MPIWTSGPLSESTAKSAPSPFCLFTPRLGDGREWKSHLVHLELLKVQANRVPAFGVQRKGGPQDERKWGPPQVNNHFLKPEPF